MRRLSVFLVISLLFVTTKVYGQYYEEEYDVPFVPTANPVVEQMLRMASVTEQDILYDLGCGDGRIVITAARDIGARGIGIDIDPLRIDECHDNAEREGVTDKVRFVNQDLFDADISEATVVSLYLLPSVNLKLRPKLFRELRPGTRIVSHDFHMGDWKEDDLTVVEGFQGVFEPDFDHSTILFWTIPANVSGDWIWADNEDENDTYTLHIDQSFQKLSGNISNKILKNISITGERLQFETEDMENGSQLYIGTVDNNIITGTIIRKTVTSFETTNWRAKRDPSTIVHIFGSSSE